MIPKTTRTTEPRIKIDPRIYRALCAEAILSDTSPKDFVEELILNSLSPKTRRFIAPVVREPGNHKTREIKKAPLVVEKDSPKKVPTTQGGRRIRISEEIKKEILRLHLEGMRNYKIAREVGVSKQTVSREILKPRSDDE